MLLGQDATQHILIQDPNKDYCEDLMHIVVANIHHQKAVLDGEKMNLLEVYLKYSILWGVRGEYILEKFSAR